MKGNRFEGSEEREYDLKERGYLSHYHKAALKGRWKATKLKGKRNEEIMGKKNIAGEEEGARKEGKSHGEKRRREGETKGRRERGLGASLNV